jgi:hypothetical protein
MVEISEKELKGFVSEVIDDVKYKWELVEGENGEIEAEKELFKEMKNWLFSKGISIRKLKEVVE